MGPARSCYFEPTLGGTPGDPQQYGARADSDYRAAGTRQPSAEAHRP